MVYGVYAIRDSKTGFLTPVLEVNDQVATRNFYHSVVNSDGVLASFSGDFALYYLADFDSDSGSFSVTALPRFVASANSALTHFSTPKSDKSDKDGDFLYV